MYTWNNEDLLDYGIVVENFPNLPKAERNTQKYTTIGRNGFISFDEETYQPVIIELNCHFNPNLTSVTYEQARAFLDGNGVLSVDGSTEYDGYVYGDINFDKVSQTSIRRFTVQFACQPFRHTITSTTKTFTSFPASLTVGGTTDTRPILEIVGSGDNTITFNGKGFILYDMDEDRTYTLDCQAMTIKDDMGNNCSSMMRYTFPKLKVGANSIECGESYIPIVDDDENVVVDDDGAVMVVSGTSGITSIKVTYREAWL